MVGVPEVQICEDLGSLQEFKSRSHEWQWVPVLYEDVVKPPVVDPGTQGLSFFSMKKNPVPAGEEDSLMIPAARELEMYSSMALHSGSDREAVVSASRSMAQGGYPGLAQHPR